MLQKQVSIGLFALLLCHTLASAIVGLSSWWQAENDLSERLQVYRTVDSVVEFQIPLQNKTDGSAIARTTEDGFRYRGHYYTVISLEVQNDRLLIAGMEAPSPSFWQDDLLAFLDGHFAPSTDTGHKGSQLLKFLLKEYSPGSSVVLPMLPAIGASSVRIPDRSLAFSTRSALIHSPPPKRAS